jgi:hypothetical protein
MRGPLWTCERCGRSFATRNQTHTCAPFGELDEHFTGKPPMVREIFDRVVAEVDAFGPVEVGWLRLAYDVGQQRHHTR